MESFEVRITLKIAGEARQLRRAPNGDKLSLGQKLGERGQLACAPSAKINHPGGLEGFDQLFCRAVGTAQLAGDFARWTNENRTGTLLRGSTEICECRKCEGIHRFFYPRTDSQALP